ncbi:glycosyltransferase [Paenibacillus sp. FSL R7-269]|uniref:glycosyltransferase n=1 Tax=Paenibacillus sp. FSL R7-269 TaxID=1226755 RepID=UPI0004B3987E|nr:glycosyltransferase [Paenibacillus sp. FSL R7-269]
MKKNFLFLGFAIPDDEMEETFYLDEFPSIQTHKFIWNMIKALENDNSFEYTYVSTRAVSDYPFYKRKFIKSKEWVVELFDRKIKIKEMPFLNLGVLKSLTRFLCGLYYCYKEYYKVDNKGGIIVYSVHVPFMMIGKLISKIFSIDFIVIWTDPPSIPNINDSFLKAKFRRIELLLSKYLMKRTSKVIALTKYLAEDFAFGIPYLVIEGIIDENDINSEFLLKNSEGGKDSIIVVYSGSLSKRYGIDKIVESFCLLTDKRLQLVVYGRGDYEEDLKKICMINENVHYKGFVTNEEIIKIQRDADFLINARSADEYYVKYSFPSKTLEYMLSGTPLISTVLPGMPEDYMNYMLVLENNEPKTIAGLLQKVSLMNKTEKYKLGLKAMEFAKSKNYVNQGKKVVSFLLGEEGAKQ